MSTRISHEGKRQLVEQYQNGESVVSLTVKTGIPKSTIYSWIKLYQTTVTATGVIVTPQKFDAMKKQISKLENMVSVLKTVNCTVSSPLQEKLHELEMLQGRFSIRVLCEALDVDRGTFYNHVLRNKRNRTSYIKRREELRIAIQEVYDDSRQLFGAGKIRAVLMDKGYEVSEKMVAKLMREMGLFSIRIAAKRNYIKHHAMEKKTNILKREFNAKSPNQVWVSDITYFKLNKKFYICVIIDLYSRKVIAHRISVRNSTQLVTSTFRQAFAERQPLEGLIFHSDRGSQYTSYAFQKLLRGHQVVQSFSNSGKPYDNAVAETFFASFKQEELYRGNYHSESAFQRSVDEYMNFYNTKRPHAGINYKIPNQSEENL